jgi:hypothetical protein
MSTFIASDITNAGRVLIAKSLTGEKIHFTRIVMGEGFMPPDMTIPEMMNVASHIVDVDITKLVINADTTVVVGGMFSNADITQEFFYRELALFAHGDDNVEVMYCYANAGEFAEKIAPMGGSSVIEKAIDIVTAIGTAQNVTATIVRTTTADEISYSDTQSQLGAGSIQEAVQILAQRTAERLPTITISDAEPTNAYEMWLKPTGEVTDLFFFLAHYYDRINKKYVPFMYTNTAKNILMSHGGAETVADAIASLNAARVYVASELFAHVGDAGLHATAGQMDNIFAALGEIMLHIEDNDIHVTADMTAFWNAAFATANEARAMAGQAATDITNLNMRLGRLEDGLFNDITGNPFLVVFGDVIGINLTRGIWNRDAQRVEC